MSLQTRKCRVCGAPAAPMLAYCYPCEDEVRVMVDEHREAMGEFDGPRKDDDVEEETDP